MQRYCAEYSVTVRVSDVMFTSDETQEEIKEKIKKIGKEKLTKWVNQKMFDPEGLVFSEEIKITTKGL